MAKPIVQFSAVAYDVNGYQGLRPQLIKKDGVVDLDLCREIVNEHQDRQRRGGERTSRDRVRGIKVEDEGGER